MEEENFQELIKGLKTKLQELITEFKEKVESLNTQDYCQKDKIKDKIDETSNEFLKEFNTNFPEKLCFITTDIIPKDSCLKFKSMTSFQKDKDCGLLIPLKFQFTYFHICTYMVFIDN